MPAIHKNNFDLKLKTIENVQFKHFENYKSYSNVNDNNVDKLQL